MVYLNTMAIGHFWNYTPFCPILKRKKRRNTGIKTPMLLFFMFLYILNIIIFIALEIIQAI